MLIDMLYSLVTGKGIENGVAYIITAGSDLIEAQIFGGFIVHVKSRTLSISQTIEQLLSGEAQKMDLSACEISPANIQPEAIKGLFRASAPFVLPAGSIPPQRLFRVLKLLQALMKADSKDVEAFDIIVKEMSNKYHNFTIDRSSVRKRMEDFSNEFLVAIPSIEGKPMPSDDRLVPAWVEESVLIPEGPFRDILLYYIYSGEVFLPVIRTTVKKEAGIGARVGCARMSKTVYGAAAGYNMVTLFKGAFKVGDLNLIWHTENKSGILITQSDLAKMNIKDGDNLSLLFNKK
jgi:hypothetical protein